MAIYHFVVRNISRGKGQNIIHKAAYNARTKLMDEKEGKNTKNYRNESPLLFEKVFLPVNAPKWMRDREALWNNAELVEKRKDARIAREVEIALPCELEPEQQVKLLTAFVQKAFVSHGMIADTVIHAATDYGDQRNSHSHILLTTRDVTELGFSKKNRDWNTVESLQSWRVIWCSKCNAFLEKYGHKARISSQSLKKQGIDRIPTKHVGPQISRMEAKGIQTRRGDYLRNKKTNPSYLEKP